MFVRDLSSHLNLWKKQLGRLPDSVWEQTNLETLVLADNGLCEVSEQIGRLTRLRMLDLGHNELTSVPDGLGDLDGLTDFLYLHDNRLSALPASWPADKVALFEHQRKRIRSTSGMRIEYVGPDGA